MSKDIIIAINKEEAIKSDDDTKYLLFEDDMYRKIKHLIIDSKIRFIELLKMCRDDYGPEGDFIIDYENLDTFRFELKELSKLETNQQDVLKFIEKLQMMINRANDDKKSIFGFAD